MTDAAGSTHAEDKSYAWYALGVMLLTYIIAFIDRQAVNLLVDPIKAELHLSERRTRIIFVSDMRQHLHQCRRSVLPTKWTKLPGAVTFTVDRGANMRALIADTDRASAWSLADRLTEAGIAVIGPARSSGEALLLATCEQPDVAILSVNLESIGAGERLADKLTSQHSTHCILTASKACEHTTLRFGESIDGADHGRIADAVVAHRKRRK